MAANLPSPTQSTTSSNTMLNGGDSTQGDLNGNGSGECAYFVCSLVLRSLPAFQCCMRKTMEPGRSSHVAYVTHRHLADVACLLNFQEVTKSRVTVARHNLNWSYILLLLTLVLYVLVVMQAGDVYGVWCSSSDFISRLPRFFLMQHWEAGRRLFRMSVANYIKPRAHKWVEGI